MPTTPTSSTRNPASRVHFDRQLAADYSSIRTEDFTIDDVDEYLNDQMHQKSIAKRLNHSGVMPPGGNAEDNWLQQFTRGPGMLLQKSASLKSETEPAEAKLLQDRDCINTSHYNQVISSLKIIKARLLAPPEEDISHLYVELPPFDAPHSK